ncbi:MAG: carboxypeptidase-like regulatory domain-containing protein, partial [Candidatus Saccharicenans sp.]|nr:carboxypeptidase-like regulatory domain-containing protein [Candidatus Saccharicenans sp.]
MKKAFFTTFLTLWLLSAGLALGQITPEGMITGKVLDDQGNPLPGVNVEATSTRLVGKATAVTDANGIYRLMALPSGYYEIVFSLPGFKKLVRKDVYLALSQNLVLNVALEPAAIEEEVTVPRPSLL